MDRLTYWNEEYGCWTYKCASGDAALALKAYEDTGLTPEKIQSLKKLASNDNKTYENVARENAQLRSELTDAHKVTKEMGDIVNKYCAAKDEALTQLNNMRAYNERTVEELNQKLTAARSLSWEAVRDITMLMKGCECRYACHVCADGDCANAPDCDPKWRGLREAIEGEVITPEMKAKVAELFVRCDELSEEQATFIEELQRRLGIAERVCSAARMYIKHINSPLCVGWDLLIDALQKWEEEKQMQAAPEQKGE